MQGPGGRPEGSEALTFASTWTSLKNMTLNGNEPDTETPYRMTSSPRAGRATETESRGAVARAGGRGGAGQPVAQDSFGPVSVFWN